MTAGPGRTEISKSSGLYSTALKVKVVGVKRKTKYIYNSEERGTEENSIETDSPPVRLKESYTESNQNFSLTVDKRQQISILIIT